MRKSYNPIKDNPQLDNFPRHRIIIPVYIPHLTGYFEHSLEVLKLCLGSLHNTLSHHDAVTIISNGSAPEVSQVLIKYFQAGWIDQLVINQTNRGKIDAVVSVARGAFADIVTISDCDVLFYHGWIEAVEDIFINFPEAGAVCPFPAPGGVWYATSATIIGGAASREIKLEQTVLEADFDLVAKGIGRDPNLKYRRKQAILRRNGIAACIGAGHFVITLRREIIDAMPRGPSLQAIEGGSEMNWLDLSPDRAGYWRLSTSKCFAYHIGNVPENHLYSQADISIERTGSRTLQLPPNHRPWISWVPYRMRVILSRLLQRIHYLP